MIRILKLNGYQKEVIARIWLFSLIDDKYRVFVSFFFNNNNNHYGKKDVRRALCLFFTLLRIKFCVVDQFNKYFAYFLYTTEKERT